MQARSRVWSLGLVGLILASATDASVAGSLRGRVTVSTGPGSQMSSINPYPGTLGSMDRVVEAGDRASAPDVVIYLEGSADAGALEPNPKLYQINQSFEPRVLGIPAGTTVEFPNRDQIFHNVFSYSKTKRFDLGYYGEGKSKQVRFDKPGLVKVFCDIHSNMAAFIYVVDTRHVTQPSDDGTYTIDNVPDGDYTLKIWHPEHGLRSRSISIDGDVEYNVTL
jgi:plastocyanin